MMTEWQWRVVIALIRYVMSQRTEWIEFTDEDENILFDALNKEDDK